MAGKAGGVLLVPPEDRPPLAAEDVVLHSPWRLGFPIGRRFWRRSLVGFALSPLLGDLMGRVVMAT